jgi:release factor glutamine methyltransferase
VFASQSPPKSFSEAILISAQILSSSALPFVSQSSKAESEQLVSAAYRKVTGVDLSRFDLLLRAREVYPKAAAQVLLNWLPARAAGRPLQYLVGYQTFFEHEYAVGPQVLIPRPETECLVAAVMNRLDSQGQVPSLGIEVGLGSGIISIELLAYWASLQMISSELSSEALELALKNAEKILWSSEHGRLTPLKVDQREHVLEPFLNLSVQADFLVSNPPYLKESLDEVGEDVMTHEPHSALFAPQDDLIYFYRKIATQAKSCLRPNGVVFAELPHERALSIMKLFQSEGWKTEVVLDLNQRERVLIAQLNF